MAKIIKRKNIWYFDDYFNHLKENEEEIPVNIKEFILDPNNYLFNTRETLHDSRLIKLKFQLNIKRSKDELVLKFLGPYQDKKYSFVFSDVSDIRFKGYNKDFKNNDLIIHQFLIKPKEEFTYEFVFVQGQKISVDFKELIITESD